METFQSNSVIIMIKADFLGICKCSCLHPKKQFYATCEYIFGVNKPDMSVPCLYCSRFSFHLDAHFEDF